jgi:ABC-type sulfate/molybdate transport systems ATPase subunit
MELLERVGCAHLAHRVSTTLSGGEQQKIALARALTTEPEILLLDEPLAALDAAGKKSIRSYLATHLQERDRPSIVVSHDARDVVSLGAEVCVIEHGEIVQRGSADTLRTNPKTEFIKAFFEA